MDKQNDLCECGHERLRHPNRWSNHCEYCKCKRFKLKIGRVDNDNN